MGTDHVTALIVSTQPRLGQKASAEVSNPLAPIAGKAVVSWIADAATAASIRRIGVVAHDLSQVGCSELLSRSDRSVIEIVPPRDDLAESIHDVLSRLDSGAELSDTDQLLLLPAEAPAINPDELRRLITDHREADNDATLMATGVGADTDTVIERNSAGEITTIRDVPIGGFSALILRASLLLPALRRALESSWEVGMPMREIVSVLDQLGHRVDVIEPAIPVESITSLAHRSPIEIRLRDRIIANWIDRGVAMPDPRLVVIDATVSIGQGVRILPGTVLEGQTVIADGASVGPNSHLIDATIGAGANIGHSVVRRVEVAPHTNVTPFSILGSESR